MYHLYLTSMDWVNIGGRFQWVTPSPGITVGMLDVRTIPECSNRGSRFPSHTFIGLSQRDNNLDGYIGEFDLESINIAISSRTIRAIESSLDMAMGTITANTPADIITQILTDLADPTGLDGVKPLIPEDSKGGASIRFAGQTLSNVAVTSAWRNNVLDVLKSDFMHIKEADLQRGSDHYSRVLGALNRKYSRFGITAADIDPTVSPRSPRTRLGDTFTDTDSTSLESHTATGANGGFSWEFLGDGGSNEWEIQSNQCERTGAAGRQADSYCRADEDLSSPDQYAEIDVIELTNTGFGDQMGAACRIEAGAGGDSAYHAVLIGNGRCYLQKTVDDTLSDIGDFTTPGDTGLVRCRARGSSVRAYHEGVLQVDEIDTSISGNVAVGLYGDNADSGAGTSVGDSWESADLLTLLNIERHYPRHVMRGVLRGAIR